MTFEPFFITGFQRSGTTLLRVMVDSHPQVAVPLDVVGLWTRYAARVSDYNDLAEAADAERMIRDLLVEERIRLWDADLSVERVLRCREREGYPGVVDAFYRAYAATQNKQYWGDKDPENMTRLHQINQWFPRSRIIHVIRDGRDACLSQLEQPFGYSRLLPCAVAWREQVSWVQRIGAILGPERYLELKYETLVAEPERTLTALCAFLGLAYSEQMLCYPENLDRSIPASKRQIWSMIDQAPQTTHVLRWQREMSPSLRTCFEKRAGEVLNDCGYETLREDPSGSYLEEGRQILTAAWIALRRRLRRASS